MARYIDATQLQAKILDASIKNKLSESREVLKIFDKMVQDMPTADVVPKSEVVRRPSPTLSGRYMKRLYIRTTQVSSLTYRSERLKRSFRIN